MGLGSNPFRSSHFWLVLNGNLEKSRKFPRESLKLGFLALPSVKHLKKYEKGGSQRDIYKYV